MPNPVQGSTLISDIIPIKRYSNAEKSFLAVNLWLKSSVEVVDWTINVIRFRSVILPGQFQNSQEQWNCILFSKSPFILTSQGTLPKLFKWSALLYSSLYFTIISNKIAYSVKPFTSPESQQTSMHRKWSQLEGVNSDVLMYLTPLISIEATDTDAL